MADPRGKRSEARSLPDDDLPGPAVGIIGAPDPTAYTIDPEARARRAERAARQGGSGPAARSR